MPVIPSQEVEGGGLEIQGHALRQSEQQADQWYMARSCLKTKELVYSSLVKGFVSMLKSLGSVISTEKKKGGEGEKKTHSILST